MRLLGLRLRGLFPLVAAVAVLIGAGNGLLGVCGPLVDVAADSFCPFVLEIFYLGITTGTSPTTFDPASNVTRLQMAAFLARTVDRTLQRGSRRSALDQYWTPKAANVLPTTTVGLEPLLPRSDGLDVWVPNTNGTVSRVRGGDGRLLETWTGAIAVRASLIAMGKVLLTGGTFPGFQGKLYQIDPTQPAGAVTTVANNLGDGPHGLTFDGLRIWTANNDGSVSIITPTAAIPWTVTTVTTGFVFPEATLFDGTNVWISDDVGRLLKVDASGAILQTVTVSFDPQFPVFDGTNIWVPIGGNSVKVVRASTGAILATLTGNGLDSPVQAAFDGQRILVTNFNGNSVSLWKAADFTELGTFPVGPATRPYGACSDGVNFWVTLYQVDKLLRF